jgi:hypothetical protein
MEWERRRRMEGGRQANTREAGAEAPTAAAAVVREKGWGAAGGCLASAAAGVEVLVVVLVLVAAAAAAAAAEEEEEAAEAAGEGRKEEKRWSLCSRRNWSHWGNVALQRTLAVADRWDAWRDAPCRVTTAHAVEAGERGLLVLLVLLLLLVVVECVVGGRGVKMSTTAVGMGWGWREEARGAAGPAVEEGGASGGTRMDSSSIFTTRSSLSVSKWLSMSVLLC